MHDDIFSIMDKSYKKHKSNKREFFIVSQRLSNNPGPRKASLSNLDKKSLSYAKGAVCNAAQQR